MPKLTGNYPREIDVCAQSPIGSSFFVDLSIAEVGKSPPALLPPSDKNGGVSTFCRSWEGKDQSGWGAPFSSSLASDAKTVPSQFSSHSKWCLRLGGSLKEIR